MPPERPPRLLRALALVRRSPLEALNRSVGLLRATIALRGCRHGKRTAAFGPVRVENAGTVSIGDGVTFSRGMIATELVSHPGAEIRIGDDCVFNYAVSIEAHASIRIGARCMVASFVRLCDRGATGVAPIVVADDVWIAHGAIIDGGVTIGAGSVVAAGAVVTRDVPPGNIAAGNPARVMSLTLAGASGPAPDGRDVVAARGR